MSLLFITEDSYRLAGVSPAFGTDTHHTGTWTALAAPDAAAIRPRALWELVHWFGQLSPAPFNLARGLELPTPILEDEQHLTQSGSKAYVPMIYAPNEALIWWVDYLASVSEAALTASWARFKALSTRLTQLSGATVDGWDPAQAALQATFPGITLQECHVQALRHWGTALATYKQQRKKARTPLTDQEEEQIRTAFLGGSRLRPPKPTRRRWRPGRPCSTRNR